MQLDYIRSLRKQPFLLALRRWGRFARNNVCDSATEIPYWWRKICPKSGQKRWLVDWVVTLHEWQTKDKRPRTSWPQDILYKHWFTSSVAESQTFLRAKRPQRRSARRNGCFHRPLYTPFFKRYRGTAGSLGIIIIIQACKAADNLYTKRKFVLYPVARKNKILLCLYFEIQWW